MASTDLSTLSLAELQDKLSGLKTAAVAPVESAPAAPVAPAEVDRSGFSPEELQTKLDSAKSTKVAGVDLSGFSPEELQTKLDAAKAAKVAVQAGPEDLSKLSVSELQDRKPIERFSQAEIFAEDADIKLFDRWKKAQPEVSVGERAVEAGAGFFKGLGAMGEMTAQSAVNKVAALIGPGTLKDRFDLTVRDTAATGAEIVAEGFKMNAMTGAYLTSLGSKVRDASMDLLSEDAGERRQAHEDNLRAERRFMRTTQELSSSHNDGRLIANDIVQRLTGVDLKLNDVAVNEEGAAFAGGFISDPALIAGAAKGALRGFISTEAKELATAGLRQLPYTGELARAAQEALVAEAARVKTVVELNRVKGGYVTKSQRGTKAATVAELEAKLGTDVSVVEEAMQRFNKQRELLDLQQAALNPPNSGKGYIQRGAGAVVGATGKVVNAVGDLAGGINEKIDAVMNKAMGPSGAGESVVNSVADRMLPAWRNIPERVAKGFGAPLVEAGRLISETESSLPYFQSLKRALPEESAGGWAASQMERFEMLASGGRWAFDTAESGAHGAVIGAGFGALNGDVVGGAVNGGLFGMTGSQYGQFAKMNSLGEVQQKQRQDVQLSRNRASKRGDVALAAFDKMSAGDQLLVATMEQSHPDLFVNATSKDGVSWYDFSNGVGEIGLDPANPIRGALVHEVKHHLGRNPLIAAAIETKLMGDPNSGVVGLFTLLDADGKPVVREIPDAMNPEIVRREFAMNPEFYKLREEYLSALKSKGIPTTDYAKNDRLIAHEIWAESESVNLLHRGSNGEFDVIGLMRQGPTQRMISEMASGSDLVSNSAFLQRSLGKFGIVFDGLSGKAANTELFSKSTKISGMNEILRKYYEMTDAERAVGDQEDSRGVRWYKDEEILKDPHLTEMFSSGFDTVKDPNSGKVRFVSEKEAKARAKDFVDTLRSELKQHVGSEPGLMSDKVHVDSLGRETTTLSGTFIPESVLTRMQESGRFNTQQINMLRTQVKLLGEGKGAEVNFMYQPAMKRGGTVYRSRPITERTETFQTINISKDGNIFSNTISLEKLQRNLGNEIKKGRATLWGNDFQSVMGDVQTYLNNHATGLPGDANGIGVDKKNFINSLFGQNNKEQREFNPYLQDLSEKAARKNSIITSRRLDRMSNMFVLSTTFKPDYNKVSMNYSPAGSAQLKGSLGKGEMNFTHYSDDGGIKELDVKRFGSSGITPNSERSGLNRSYAYAEGSKLGSDKVLVGGRKNSYSGKVSKGLIYDGVKDPLELMSGPRSINREKRDQILKDSGFTGLYREGNGGVLQLEFLKKVGVTKNEPAPVRSAKSGHLRQSLHETDAQFSPGRGNAESRKIAEEYAMKAGVKYKPHSGYDELPEAKIRAIADHFVDAKHAPDDPEVKKSYRALADETKAQYQSMVDAGIRIEPFTGKGEPYKSSEEMMADVRDNKHLSFFLTDQAFGEGKNSSDNPLLEKSGISIGGKELLNNDLFRAVHDFFGHTQQGFQFGPRGEFNSWKEHSRMFSDEAQGALGAETLAQNAWVNFGPHLRDASGNIAKKGEAGFVSPTERPFAEQKNFVLPEALRQFSPGPRIKLPSWAKHADLNEEGVLFVNHSVKKSTPTLNKNVLEVSPQEMFSRLDAANAKIKVDPARFADPVGYLEYMREAGVSGDVMVAPPLLKTMLETPQKYVDNLLGGYHGEKTKSGTMEAADAGLDATVKMREAMGGRPPEMVTALHHLWGILSRMLPPVEQESAWLRLVSRPEILAQIQSSIDGNYNLSDSQWSAQVSKSLAETREVSKGRGNQGTANANAFHLMLDRWNGLWGNASDVYAHSNAIDSGRAFWALGQGPVGIKNKVQRFIGLTFGTPGLIMDRWKFVEFYHPQFDKKSRDYFKYSETGTPEDPNGIYAAYGKIESSSPAFSLAFYEGMETALQQAIDRSPELKKVLGRHANVGGLHWKGWNAIKNEAVGHSSLDLTYDLVNSSDDPTPDSVLKLFKNKEYFTEGLVGNSLQRFTLPKSP